jgi:hypothetical protein
MLHENRYDSQSKNIKYYYAAQVRMASELSTTVQTITFLEATTEKHFI